MGLLYFFSHYFMVRGDEQGREVVGRCVFGSACEGGWAHGCGWGCAPYTDMPAGGATLRPARPRAPYTPHLVSLLPWACSTSSVTTSWYGMSTGGGRVHRACVRLSRESCAVVSHR